MEPYSLGIGLGLSALGSLTSVFGSHAAATAQKDEIAAQQKAEAIRNAAMNNDAMRKRRELVRQGIIARSQALTTTSGQGVTGGSALSGAYGTIAGQEEWAATGINQAQAFGQGIFQANQEYAGAKMRALDAGETSQIGAGLSSLGGAVLSNVKNIDRIGGYFSGNG